MNDRAIKLIDKCISGLILGVIFLMPLYLNPFVALNFQKVHLFRVSVEIILLLYIIGVFLRNKIKFKKNTFFYLFIFFLFLAQLSATIFSAQPYVSFWGSYVRQLGLFTWLHIYIFSFIVYNFFDGENLSFKRIFLSISASGSISAIYGLMQTSGFDFLVWKQSRDGWQERAPSTLGQPNFFATFLLFSLSITVYFFLTAKGLIKKCLFFILSLIQLLAIVFTFSRSAWLGLAGAAIIFIFVYLWSKNKHVFFIILGVFFVSLFFLFSSLIKEKISSDYQLTIGNRLRSAVDMQSGSVGMRRLYYEAALQIIKSNPIVGHGLDTQGYYFYKHYNKNYPLFERINTYPDRAHSEFLDIFITVGLFGLSAWLFFAIGFFRNIYLFYGRQENVQDKRILSVVLFALLSVLISVSFGFFTETDLVYFWLFLVFAIIIVFKKDEAIFEFKMRKSLAIIFLSSFMLLMATIAWIGNIKPEISDYYLSRAQLARKYNDFNGSLDYFNSALNHSPGEIYYRNRFAVDNLPVVLSITDPAERLTSLEYLKTALVEKGEINFTFESRAYLAIVLSEIGRLKSNRGDDISEIVEFSESEEVFHKMLEDNPEMARVHLDYGTLLFYEKKFDESIIELEKAISLYPALNDSRMNLEHREFVSRELFLVYKRAIDVEASQKKYDKALEYAEKAKKLYPGDLELWDKISVIYSKTDRLVELVPIFEHLAVLYPGNIGVQNQLKLLSGYQNKN